MSTRKGTMYHPVNGSPEETWAGFSWPCLFFGCFWYLYKGTWGWAIISAGVSLLTYGIAWLVFPFFANGQHETSLIKRGYLTEAQWETKGRESVTAKTQEPVLGKSHVADEITKLATLREQGVLTEEEFQQQKKKLLA